MLNYLKELFINNSEEEIEKNTHKLEIAACALLMEIANADEEFSDEERVKIIELMKKKFNLSEEEALNIISKSEEEIQKSVSIYEFTDILNNNLNNDEKYSILKHLWRIAYADGNLDAYEDHYIKKISNNLHIYNQERIAAKLEVKEELGL
ncbi:MAG: TerB family tellurite resistance protein [Melioribacteraceae bacterium]|nr:TerB family tellurite resistance protein [Melioribacteraceae bacterium]